MYFISIGTFITFSILLLSYTITARRHVFSISRIITDQDIIKVVKTKNPNLIFIGADKDKLIKIVDKKIPSKSKKITSTKKPKLSKTTKKPIVSKTSTTSGPNLNVNVTNKSPLDYSQIIRKFYQDTNYYRKKHGVPNLKINPFLQLLAKKHALKMANSNEMTHDTDKNYGENLAFSDDSGNDAVKKWYDEIAKYDYNKPEFSYATSHFTALVWKSTTEMGCGLAQSTKTKRTFVCCKYNKPGNIKGEFKENVLPAKN
uniref:SCP domain-containing protein n=1 Tax=Strongyloides stercoralis TaxID=6248 RepID=A0A0K0E6J7_STRER